MSSHPFRFIRNLSRSREIASVLFKHGFGDLVERLHLRRYLQWGVRVLLRRKQEPNRSHSRGARIRMTLESLGATFIKFGQVISTRGDLIPADVIEELSKLQEDVPPFPSDVALQIIYKEFGRSVDELFAEFDPKPIAAASLSQVHRARLHDGTSVAVKIRRPNVARDVERDLGLMLELAVLIERYIPESKVFDPVGLVNHFSRAIRSELNFTREGRTLGEFARLFKNDATLHVPKVYPELTTESVVTMEFIDGFRVDDFEALEAAGISRREVAANGARIFMKQAFETGLFHGDPHPGNIRIMPDGSICLLDYGMVGLLEESLRESLVDLLVAIARRDVNTAVDVMRKIGEPHREIDAPILRADVRDFVENYYDIPLDRMNVGQLLSDFVSVLANHGIRCPADLMLLVRALVTLEGVGRSLDSNFNLAEHLTPFVERIVRERYHPGRVVNRLLAGSKSFAHLAYNAPLQLGTIIEKLSKDELKIQLEHRSLDTFINELDRSSNRVVIGVVMSSLMISTALIVGQSADNKMFTLPLFVLWSLLGIWLIYGVFRSGRL